MIHKNNRNPGYINFILTQKGRGENVIKWKQSEESKKIQKKITFVFLLGLYTFLIAKKLDDFFYCKKSCHDGKLFITKTTFFLRKGWVELFKIPHKSSFLLFKNIIRRTVKLSIQFLNIITNERNGFTLKINTFQEFVREFNQVATNIT